MEMKSLQFTISQYWADQLQYWQQLALKVSFLHTMYLRNLSIGMSTNFWWVWATVVPLFIGDTFAKALYWCNFLLDKNSILLIIGAGIVVHFTALFAYSFIWTSYFGYFHPMPINLYVLVTLSYSAVMLTTGYRLVCLS